jgi:hypothetical protein
MALEKAIASTTNIRPPTFASEQPVMNATSSSVFALKEPATNATFSFTYQIQQNNGTVIILDLLGLDTRVTRLSSLRDEISFLLHEHRNRVSQAVESALSSNDTILNTNKRTMEVVVLLESPGGSAQDYGLAAQQLLRLRNERGISLTICVDKVAASGGSYPERCCMRFGGHCPYLLTF